MFLGSRFGLTNTWVQPLAYAIKTNPCFSLTSDPLLSLMLQFLPSQISNFSHWCLENKQGQVHLCSASAQQFITDECYKKFIQQNFDTFMALSVVSRSHINAMVRYLTLKCRHPSNLWLTKRTLVKLIVIPLAYSNDWVWVALPLGGTVGATTDTRFYQDIWLSRCTCVQPFQI